MTLSFSLKQAADHRVIADRDCLKHQTVALGQVAALVASRRSELLLWTRILWGKSVARRTRNLLGRVVAEEPHQDAGDLIYVRLVRANGRAGRSLREVIEGFQNSMESD